MKKYMLDMKVVDNCRLHKNYCLLKLTSDNILPGMMPGQFVQVRVDNSPKTFLRRPISINYVDRENNQLWLLIQLVGEGTRKLAEANKGDIINLMLPLGNGFTIPEDNKDQKLLLVGGGVGMAPLRAQIMHMMKTLHTTDRKMSYFYGARALNEVFYLNDFLELEKEFPNFTFHLALDRPDPAADAAGVKYTAGFVHQVIYNTYLKDHEAPEDIEYYMCGPGPMSKAVENMLDSLGVPMEMLHFDNFGG